MLEHVQLPNVYLSQKGLLQVRDMQVLSVCIEPNGIEYLNLSQNTLGTPFMVDLERLLLRQNKSLKSLHLSDCGLTDPNMFQVLTTLNNLQELNISQNIMSDNVGVQFMAVLPNLANLTNLDISRCNFGPLTMKALEDSRFCDNGIYPQNKGLAVVSASFNKLQSVGVNHLTAALCQRTSTSLLTLKLQQVDISENDQNHCVRALHKLMSLKNARLAELDLSNNPLTARMNWIAQGINDSIHLHTLRLNKCSLTTDSLTEITNVLQFSQSLTCLELSDNILGKSGADLIAQVLQKRHKLQQLKLNNCGLTSVGILTILRACSGQNVNFNVTRLELENNCDVDFSRLKYGDRNLTDAFSKLNSTLVYLELSKNGINDEDVRNALKQSWEEIHGKEQLSIFISNVSLRFIKKPRKN
jgi:Ran GTPase-activating protein (RanGAP) involved in mRNA processing and transport